jgi:rhodanese-related sulfurtransferase
MNRMITAEDLQNVMGKNPDILLLDVRRKADYDSDPVMIPRAAWKDPEQVNEWCGDLPPGKDIVVYCVRGGSVSNSVLDRLLQNNLKARYIEGGLAGWKNFGGGTIPISS